MCIQEPKGKAEDVEEGGRDSLASVSLLSVKLGSSKQTVGICDVQVRFDSLMQKAGVFLFINSQLSGTFMALIFQGLVVGFSGLMFTWNYFQALFSETSASLFVKQGW